MSSTAGGVPSAALEALRGKSEAPESVVVAALCKVVDGFDVGGAPTAFEKRLTAYVLGDVDELPTHNFRALVEEASAGMEGVADDAGVERDVKQYILPILRSPHGLERLLADLCTFTDGSSIQHKASPISVFCRRLVLQWQAVTYREQDRLWMQLRQYLLPYAAYIESLPDTESDSEMEEEEYEEEEEEEDSTLCMNLMPAPVSQTAPLQAIRGLGEAPGVGGFLAPLPEGVHDPTVVDGLLSSAARVDPRTAEVLRPPKRLAEPTPGDVLKALAVGDVGALEAALARGNGLGGVEDDAEAHGLTGLAAFHYYTDTGNRQRAIDSCLRYFISCVAAQQGPRGAASGGSAASGPAGAGAQAPSGGASAGGHKEEAMRGACAWALLHLAYVHTQFDDATAARRCVDEATRTALSLADKDVLVTCGYFTVVLCLKDGLVEEAVEELLYAFRVGAAVAGSHALGMLYAALANLRLWFPAVLSKHAEQFVPFLPPIHSTNAPAHGEGGKAGATGGVIGATLPGEQQAHLAVALPSLHGDDGSEGTMEMQGSLCMPQHQHSAAVWGEDGRGSSGTGSGVAAVWMALRAAWLHIPRTTGALQAAPFRQVFGGDDGVARLFGGQPPLKHSAKHADPMCPLGLSSRHRSYGDAFVGCGAGRLTLLKAQLLEQLGMHDMALAELAGGDRGGEAGYTAQNRALAAQHVLTLLKAKSDFRGATMKLSAIAAVTSDLSRHVTIQQLVLYTTAWSRLGQGRATAALALVDRALALRDDYLPTPDEPVVLHPYLYSLRIRCLTHSAVQRYDDALRTALEQLDRARKASCTQWIALYSTHVIEVHSLCGTHGMTSTYVTNALRLCDEAVLPTEKAALLLLVAANHLGDGEVVRAKALLLHVWGTLQGHLTASLHQRFRFLGAQVLVAMEVDEPAAVEGAEGNWMLEDDPPAPLLFPSVSGVPVPVGTRAAAVALAMDYLAPAYALPLDEEFHCHTLASEVLRVAVDGGLAHHEEAEAAAARAVDTLRRMTAAEAAAVPEAATAAELLCELRQGLGTDTPPNVHMHR